MSNTPNPQITTITLPVSQNQSVDLAKLFKKYLFHWPLFFIGITLISALAFLYLKAANPVYPIKATLEFKDDKNAPATNNTNGLQELDQLNKPVIVENEIEVMKSKQIMFQVVNKLKLWVNYSYKEGLRTSDLYTSSPVNFEFIKAPRSYDPAGDKLEIMIVDNNNFRLKDKEGKLTQFKFGQAIVNEYGTWKLTPTSTLSTYIGSTIKMSVVDADQMTDGLISNLSVALENKDAPFVNLTYSDQVPQRGKDILNGIMDQYNVAAVNHKTKMAQNAIAFIDKRLDSIKKNLHGLEGRVANFKTGAGVTDTKLASQSLVQNQQEVKKSLNDVDIQLDIVNGIETYINSPKNFDKQPSTGNLSDNGLNTMLDKLSDLQLKKDQLLATTPEKNPIFNPLNKQISTLQESIKEKILSIKSGLVSTKKQLQSFDSKSQTSISKIPEVDRAVNGMQRDQDVEEQLYIYLLQKKEQISLGYSSFVSDAQIVDEAHASKPKWPKPAIVYFMAVIIGLSLPAGLLYARDSFDDRITNRKQIEDVVTLPILGELSFQQSSTPIVITQGRGKFAIGEQFRVLRTNLYHVHGTNDSGRVTLFTSSTGGEGKSFVSGNLAVTLAYASRKTIILEMDLRKPKISLSFGLPTDHLGISDYLNGDISDLSAIIQPSGIPGLDVLGCGSILPNPSELLEKTSLDELILSLRKIYDDILIDTPPIHLVTDALIVARVSDAALYIMRQGYTQKDELYFINEINAEKRFSKLNIVFNGIKRDKYGYGYNYDNSYYNKYTESEKKSFNIGAIMKKFFSRF